MRARGPTRTTRTRGHAGPRHDRGPPPEPEPDPEPERPHRPRPSASAPLIYDEDIAEPEADQSSTTDPSEAKPADKAADEPEPAPAKQEVAKQDAAKQEAPKDEPKKPDKRVARGLPSWVRRLRTFVIVIVIALAAAWALRTYVVAPYYVPSASMEPTLHGCSNCNDDHVLVQKLSYDFHDPERSDIVVFDNPGGAWKRADDAVLIKRVIGVPGDRLSIRNRKVYVNGQLLDEPYVNKSCHGTTPNGGPRSYKVPKGDLFVMGDNRCDSEDSRVFGYVPIDKVIGKALLIFWPLGRFGSP